MVVDLILDRYDGFSYSPADFYRDAMGYGKVADRITKAFDFGGESDIKKALCDYIKEQEYNPKICEYIRRVKWLTPDNGTDGNAIFPIC